MPYAQVANLDFEDIKSSIKEYLRSTSDFTDYDFEGSAFATLIDVLAYNTYYTAFNTNMVANELFLGSATLRDNVVSIAKQLGYRPKSITAPTAYVSFTVTYNTTTLDTELILKSGTGFITSYDNNLYQYVAVKDVKAQVINNSATFTNVPVLEGSYITNTSVVNTAIKNQRYVIDNPGVDTNTITVKVYQDVNSTVFDEFLLIDNILNASPTSKIYHLEEVEDERYELVFGDGVIGRALQNGEKVEISYLITNGPTSNGVKSFSFNGRVENPNGVSPSSPVISIDTSATVASAGGENIENLDKIKYTAPRAYAAQNRAVTSNDYDALIRNIYPAVSDIIIFGGEDQVPPQYGRVFIAIKPEDAAYLTSITKQEIKKELKKYSVASIVPELVDPSILYVELTSKIFYNRSKTSNKPAQIQSEVIGAIQSYIDTSNTEKFNGKFRYSKSVAVIDNTDIAINSNLTSVTMRKDFIPLINSTTFYEICYQNQFLDDDDPVVSSSGFVVTEYPNYTVYLEDKLGKIVLYRIDSATGQKVVLNDFVGTVDYEKGEIKMNDLTIIKGSFVDNRIQLRVLPKQNDIIASREVYLDVDIANSSFIAYAE
jgi:hypothetical protein